MLKYDFMLKNNKLNQIGQYLPWFGSVTTRALWDESFRFGPVTTRALGMSRYRIFTVTTRSHGTSRPRK